MMHLMYKKKKRFNTFTICFLGLFLSLLSGVVTPAFGQVKNYTTVKKRIKNSFNFEKTKDKPGRQNIDESVYKVFSDRAENLVYLDPYSQKSGENQDFLTPYYVLGQKNDHLKIATAAPEILGKPKGMFSFIFGDNYSFKEGKSVKYVGWIHKNNVIHYAHSKLSRCNYKPLRYVIGVHDVKTLYNSAKFVEKDTVHLFNDPLFKEKSAKKLMLNQFVFLYKYSVDKKAALVSNLANLKLKDSTARTMGWIPEFLLKKIGQQQVYAVNNLDSLSFLGKTKKDKEHISKGEVGDAFIFDVSKHHKRSKQVTDSVWAAVPLNVWDHRDNKLINVDGEDVLIRKLKDIKRDNKKINFHYVFDCGKDLKKKQLLLMSSLQKIWILISSEEKYKGYEFTFSASSYGCGKFYALPKTKSFSLWIDYLQNIFLDVNNEVVSEVNTGGIAQCFEYAIRDIPAQSFMNNIIIVSGEKRFFTPPNIKEITQKLGETSSRIIFYQLESKVDDQHQDYILQSKDILSKVSTSHASFIRSFIVENDLIKNKNTFTNIPAVDNIYLYDAPDNSTYQGGITFPRINKVLSATSFDKTLDSVLSKTIHFNAVFTGSLEYHAKRLGFLRSKSGNKIKEMILNDSTYANNLGTLPRNYMFEKYYKNKKYTQKDNPNAVLGYLLSKEELELVIDGYKSLIPLYSKEVKRKDRKRLFRIYRKNSRLINKNLFVKILRRRNYMADLVYIKTGMPVNSAFLLKTKIKHIKRKGKTSHVDFASIMKELRKKITILEETLSNKKTKKYKDGSKKEYYFISNNQIL
ncbi:hypothetical protein CXF68_19945 [Tenacibaculum sp. Bg11-29]|uniref:type VI secretion system protein TssR domain-containing protein n=1 Tax=Tenacibaculum sp. Bg11-29 TaxID=2058306 RepID=UPI000C3439A1|nr:type VI secretion system protein TssR domain-containing protein [Tenacibaculum sp. Bg11-29]PKH52828.1 hypothetical protein CXF68_19945 [Tenacibaculum sp. Bg11-29]